MTKLISYDLQLDNFIIKFGYARDIAQLIAKMSAEPFLHGILQKNIKDNPNWKCKNTIIGRGIISYLKENHNFEVTVPVKNILINQNNKTAESSIVYLENNEIKISTNFDNVEKYFELIKNNKDYNIYQKLNDLLYLGLKIDKSIVTYLKQTMSLFEINLLLCQDNEINFKKSLVKPFLYFIKKLNPKHIIIWSPFDSDEKIKKYIKFWKRHKYYVISNSTDCNDISPSHKEKVVWIYRQSPNFLLDSIHVDGFYLRDLCYNSLQHKSFVDLLIYNAPLSNSFKEYNSFPIEYNIKKIIKINTGK